MGSHALPPKAITAAADELIRDCSAMSLKAANHQIPGVNNAFALRPTPG
jgi:hypothetical protein